MEDESGELEEQEERSEATHFCVAVRCRPMNEREQSSGCQHALHFPGLSQVVFRHANDVHTFNFDHVFWPEASQEEIFRTLGEPQLDKAFDGYNGTIFAYGQTGTGKTHTMMNHSGKHEDYGLALRISEALYQRIGRFAETHKTRRFLVQCSLLEIYNEVVYDLLVPRSQQPRGGGLEVKENKGLGVYVKDLLEEVVEGPERLAQLMREGFENRMTSSTRMNDASSRSHCIFTIKLHQKDTEDSSMNTVCKLSLVDLAGSERAKSTEAEGLRLKEGANINKSLSALGNVINALSSAVGSGKKKAFVPYRNSKLTRVLQESFGGNSLCTMIAAVSPASFVAEETLSTLNYARRAKAIRVSATRNEEDAHLRRLHVEVEALQKRFQNEAQEAAGTHELQELQDRHREEIETLQSFMCQSWEDKQRLEEERKQARREAQRVKDQAKREQRRRLELLEQQDDLQLTLQSLVALTGAECSGWAEMFAGLLKAGQQVRSQLRAVRLYWASTGADFEALWGCVHADLGASLLMLGQVRAKLECMLGELGALSSLEAQLQEQMGRLTPHVAVALCQVRDELGDADPGMSDEAFQAREEVSEVLALLQRQLSRYHVKEQLFMQEEAQRMDLGAEIRRLHQCLLEHGEPIKPIQVSSEQQMLLAELQQAASATEAAVAVGTGREEVLPQLPWPLGLSTFEVPDECFGASSNLGASPSARLLRTGTYGGWCPCKDSEEEYLEIDLGLQEHRAVAGISLEGRVPCTGHWMQTRELLRLARDSGDAEAWSPPDKTFIRPPVRFVYDMSMELIQRRGCLGTGQEGWTMPPRFLRFSEMTAEVKAEFFQQLIWRTKKAWEGSNGPTLDLSPQDILTGRNCEETNRLLQLLACATLFGRRGEAVDGLGTVAPQWTTAWKLEYYTESGGWQWLGGSTSEAATVFAGNSDPHGVKYVGLQQVLRTTRLRLHPVAWHGHAGLRCELHMVALPGVDIDEGPKDWLPIASAHLRARVDLACRGSCAIQLDLERRQEEHQRLQRAREEQVEQESGQQEQRVRDALERAEELEARAVAAETALLRARAETERLSAAVEQLEAERTGSGTTAATNGPNPRLQRECDDLRATADELSQRLAVASDERDSARAHGEELFHLFGAKNGDLSKAHQSHADLSQRLRERELQLEATELRVHQLEHLGAQLAELQATHDGVLQHCQKLESQVQCLEAENKALTVEREKLVHKKDKLQAKKEALQQKLEESEQMRLAARDRCQRMLERHLTDKESLAITSRTDLHSAHSPAGTLQPDNQTKRIAPAPECEDRGRIPGGSDAGRPSWTAEGGQESETTAGQWR